MRGAAVLAGAAVHLILVLGALGFEFQPGDKVLDGKQIMEQHLSHQQPQVDVQVGGSQSRTEEAVGLGTVRRLLMEDAPPAAAAGSLPYREDAAHIGHVAYRQPLLARRKRRVSAAPATVPARKKGIILK